MTGEQERPERPGLVALAVNFGKAVVAHAADGFQPADPMTQSVRLAACQGCDLRRPEDNVCLHPDCGCYINVKVQWRTQDCPLGKWPKPGLPPASGDAPPQDCGCGK